MTDTPAFHLPLHDFVGLIAESPGPPAVMSMPLTDAVKGAVAPLHGGLVAALADVTCAYALSGNFDPAVEVPVSTELHVRYFAQPKEGPIRCEAEIVHRGSRITSVECVITDGGGRQLARAAGTYMIVKGFGRLSQP